MKILMLSSGDRVPSSRFRMIPYVRHFRDRGHQCVIAHSHPQKYDWYRTIGFRLSQRLKLGIRQLNLRRSKSRNDEIVIVDREIFDSPGLEMERRFREQTAYFVLDLDDAVFLRYPEKFEQLVKMADLVICGNPFIEEWAKERGAETVIIPTCVEMSQYPAKNYGASGETLLQIGWIGTTGNLRYLNVAAGGLRKLAEKRQFELCLIVPDIEPLVEVNLEGVNVRHVQWDKHREVEQLLSIDVGLMPLFSDEIWDRYKCGLKLIQYMAAAIPAVASPVGVNATIVTHGEDSFLASTDDEWATHLGTLLDDAEIRKRIGQAARQTVAEKYSIEANFPRYEEALQQLISFQKTPAK